MTEQEKPFVDIFYVDEPYPTLSFRSGLTTYDESLINGRLVGRNWNGAGYVNCWESMRLDPAKHPTPESFILEVDGQRLTSHWEWMSFEKNMEGEKLHAVLSLRHKVRPVTVQVHTLLDGTAVITRWLDVTNTKDSPAALSAISPWSGVLQSVSRWRAHISDPNMPLYSLGYFEDTHWGNEGSFRWHALPNAGYRVDGKWRRDRHRHPMFVLRNNATGEHFICQLAWSGGFSFDFDLDADIGTQDGMARLCFSAGPAAPAPLRLIDPGETVHSPEVHLGMLFGDLDASIQAMHDHMRRSVFLPQPRGRGCWVETGIGPELEVTQERTINQIECAAKMGSELFFIDASWYAPPYSNWWSTVGDWEVDWSRWSGGLKPIRDLIHSKGMLFGLWMDAERIAADCKIRQQHPEWVATAYDGVTPLGDLIDLTNPAAAAWMEEQICKVISENELEFFRLDYNVGGLGAGSCVIRNGYVENSYWRYYEALYAIYERVRQRFPNVILENCAGGGGRTDLGMVKRFSHTWVTDWQIAPRAFSITNGMSMALPPEYVDRLMAGQDGHILGDLDFQARLLLFVRPSVAFINTLNQGLNPQQFARVTHMIDLYKNFVRTFQTTSKIYHHTPEFTTPEPQGWGVLELDSADKTRGIAGVFQLSAPNQSEYLLRLRGLDVSKRYKVTFDNSGRTCLVDGFVLMNQGLTIRLEGALTSELLIFEAE